MNDSLRVIAVLEDMAQKAGVTLDKAVQMIKVYETVKTTAVNDRRSQPHERDLLQKELRKLDEMTLRNATSRELADALVDRGVAIRPRVQGVLAFISRTRKQLLLTHQPSAAAA